jgi:predicted dehydrogenase
MTYQREYTRRLNVAVVGVGAHAYRNLLPALHYLPVRLVAVCDVDEERARLTAAEYGVAAYTRSADLYASEQLDAVFLSVRPRLHPELAAEALSAGLHVWIEKPPALRAAQIETLRQQAGDRVVVVGFKKAFMPAVDKASELVAGGTVGELASVLAEYPVSVPTNGAELLESGKSSDWLSNGCHPLSLLLRLAGEVSAVSTYRGVRGGGAVILEHTNGVVSTLHLSAWNGYAADTERYHIDGTSGAILIENSTRVSLQRGIPFDYNRTASFAPQGMEHGSVVWEVQNRFATLESKALFLQGLVGEMLYFCNCILDGRAAEIGSLSFALQVMRVYEAALLSEGQRVPLAQSLRPQTGV